MRLPVPDKGFLFRVDRGRVLKVRGARGLDDKLRGDWSCGKKVPPNKVEVHFDGDRMRLTVNGEDFGPIWVRGKNAGTDRMLFEIPDTDGDGIQDGPVLQQRPRVRRGLRAGGEPARGSARQRLRLVLRERRVRGLAALQRRPAEVTEVQRGGGRLRLPQLGRREHRASRRGGHDPLRRRPGPRWTLRLGGERPRRPRTRPRVPLVPHHGAVPPRRGGPRWWAVVDTLLAACGRRRPRRRRVPRRSQTRRGVSSPSAPRPDPGHSSSMISSNRLDP